MKEAKYAQINSSSVRINPSILRTIVYSKVQCTEDPHRNFTQMVKVLNDTTTKGYI
jgi:hypothetical protein